MIAIVGSSFVAILVVAALGLAVAQSGQGGLGTSSNLRTIATFHGSGDGKTAHFHTSGSWVLAWSCKPSVDGASAPFGFTITVNTPDNHILGTKVLDTHCDAFSTHGTVRVRQTGEQWLSVGTGGVGGPWTLSVEVAGGDARVLVPPKLLTAGRRSPGTYP
jgi:hypothetical protein